MLLVDANVLIYAVNSEAVRHEEARSWLDRSLNRNETVGFAWVVLLAFLRLTTRTGLFARPLEPVQAAAVVESWLAQPAAVVVHPTPRHVAVLAGLMSSLGTGGNLVNDAHLAALAVEHGGQVVSYDSDFSRFPGVRWRLPA